MPLEGILLSDSGMGGGSGASGSSSSGGGRQPQSSSSSVGKGGGARGSRRAPPVQVTHECLSGEYLIWNGSIGEVCRQTVLLRDERGAIAAGEGGS